MLMNKFHEIRYLNNTEIRSFIFIDIAYFLKLQRHTFDPHICFVNHRHERILKRRYISVLNDLIPKCM